MTKCSQEVYIYYKNILNSEWSEGSYGFTIILIIFFSVINSLHAVGVVLNRYLACSRLRLLHSKI
jgi:hypothetical protein